MAGTTRGTAGRCPAEESGMIPDLERTLDEQQRKLDQLRVFL
jgi:hypothetical protein